MFLSFTLKIHTLYEYLKIGMCIKKSIVFFPCSVLPKIMRRNVVETSQIKWLDCFLRHQASWWSLQRLFVSTGSIFWCPWVSSLAFIWTDGMTRSSRHSGTRALYTAGHLSSYQLRVCVFVCKWMCSECVTVISGNWSPVRSTPGSEAPPLIFIGSDSHHVYIVCAATVSLITNMLQ